MRLVFDLDGTLADGSHREHFITGEEKDWDAFFEACDGDKPHAHVIEVLQSLDRQGHYIEIWSGRSTGRSTPQTPGGTVLHKTLAWLDAHGIGVAWDPARTRRAPVSNLRMRPHGDHSPDDELKRGWLQNARRFKHEGVKVPELVFDDRQRVVDMWREEGIPCFQVAPGDF